MSLTERQTVKPTPYKGVLVKTYVVLVRDNLVREGQNNVRIMAVRLTRKAAEEIRDKIAGAWVERHDATKRNNLIPIEKT